MTLMTTFWTLLRQETRSLTQTPITYWMAGAFTFLMGVLFFLTLERFVHVTQIKPLFEGFFELFWLPLLFFVPMLTMRSLAQERQEGLLESTVATGASKGAIVLSKFLALFGFYVALWALCLSFPVLLRWVLGSRMVPPGLFESGTFWGSYAFILLSGGFYLALGLFCSSLTENPALAGVMTFCLLFLIVVASQFLPETATLPSWLQGSVEALQNLRQLGDFSRGIVDSRPLLFYLSSTGLLLGLTTLRI